jgi:hypothetical protein
MKPADELLSPVGEIVKGVRTKLDKRMPFSKPSPCTSSNGTAVLPAASLIAVSVSHYPAVFDVLP